jgi:hypothetical protein
MRIQPILEDVQLLQLQPQAELHVTGFLVNIMTRSGWLSMEGAFDG